MGVVEEENATEISPNSTVKINSWTKVMPRNVVVVEVDGNRNDSDNDAYDDDNNWCTSSSSRGGGGDIGTYSYIIFI